MLLAGGGGGGGWCWCYCFCPPTFSPHAYCDVLCLVVIRKLGGVIKEPGLSAVSVVSSVVASAHSFFVGVVVMSSSSQADYQRLVQEKAAFLDARAAARKEASAKKTAEKVGPSSLSSTSCCTNHLQLTAKGVAVVSCVSSCGKVSRRKTASLRGGTALYLDPPPPPYLSSLRWGQ